MVRRTLKAAALGVSPDPSTFWGLGSDAAVMARICPARSSLSCTVTPGAGGTSEWQKSSMPKRYCRPSAMSKPGPVRGSRTILPRFFMVLRGCWELIANRAVVRVHPRCAKLSRIGSQARFLPPAGLLLLISHCVKRGAKPSCRFDIHCANPLSSGAKLARPAKSERL